MDWCAELHTSCALRWKNLHKPSSGRCLQIPPSGTVCLGHFRHHPDVFPPCVGSSFIQCSVTTSEIVELSPVLTADNPPEYPAISNDEAQEVELASDDIEYINSLATRIRECSIKKDHTTGERIHSHIIFCGLDSDRYLGNLLILMYGNCGYLEEAEAVFRVIPSPNIYSANMMINAYVTNDELEKALGFFHNMAQRNRPSWNAMISALAKSGQGKKAIKYYHAMLEEGFTPNIITCVSTIDACADAAELGEGMKLHSSVVVHGFDDFIVATALMNMYGQSGSLESARDIFRRFSQHDVFSWSAMIAACVNNGCNQEALQMFDNMPNEGLEPTIATYLSILIACGNLINLSKGQQTHAQMLYKDCQLDIKVENALINMYAKCQSLEDSLILFQSMPQRNIITWTTMMAALSSNGRSEDTIEFLFKMQADCVNPNNHSISIAFDACATIEALEEGQRIYMYSASVGIELDFITAVTLINMYGKCGTIEDAKALFQSFEEHGLLLWNAMMLAYAVNGKDNEVRELFEEMQSKGIEPNKATLKIIEDLGSSAFIGSKP